MNMGIENHGPLRYLDVMKAHWMESVSYTHLRAHETVLDLVCRLLLEKKKEEHNNMHYNIYRAQKNEQIHVMCDPNIEYTTVHYTK